MDSDTVNQAKSVYPLDDFATIIQKSAENGTLVITNKNKADEMLAPIGIQPSQRSRIISLAKDVLSQNEPIVNTRSMQKTESDTTKFSLKEKMKFIENKKIPNRVCRINPTPRLR